MMSIDERPHRRLIARPAVEAATGLRRSTIYQLIAAGEFPRPVKISSASRWVESEVLAWVDRRIAERDAVDEARQRLAQRRSAA